jgi:hypothetical protein
MEVLKKMWENKMTRMYLLVAGGLILLFLIVIIVASSGSRVVNDNTLTNAAASYISNNPSLAPKNNYESKNISMLTLVSEGYISDKKEGSSCSSYVIVTKVDGEYYYTPYIKCNNENDTVLLRNKLLKSVVTDGPGLYSNENEYIYRGEVKNNYVLVNGYLWRIIGIDENNNIRLINNIPFDYVIWDDRYNSVLDSQDGINDYSLSRIKDVLNDYENALSDDNKEIFTGEVKSRMVKFDQCYESIDLENMVSTECNTFVEDQLFGMIRVKDYVDASLDPSCSYTTIKNCQNYNFLNRSSWTVSSYSGDNNQVYYIDQNNGIVLRKALYTNTAYPTMVLRSDIIYLSGTGTETDPYNIK